MLWLASHIDGYHLSPNQAVLDWIDNFGDSRQTVIKLGEFDKQPDNLEVFTMIVDKAMAE